MIGVVSMARLKIVGIINENEIIKYQKYNTNKKMTSINNGKDNIQIKAIPISIIFSIILFAIGIYMWKFLMKYIKFVSDKRKQLYIDL